MPVTSLDWIGVFKYDFLGEKWWKCEILGLSSI